MCVCMCVKVGEWVKVCLSVGGCYGVYACIYVCVCLHLLTIFFLSQRTDVPI